VCWRQFIAERSRFQSGETGGWSELTVARVAAGATRAELNP
jgi:hypothetical protein